MIKGGTIVDECNTKVAVRSFASEDGGGSCTINGRHFLLSSAMMDEISEMKTTGPMTPETRPRIIL